MSKLMDLTGERYGRLVVIERVADIVQPSGRRTRWLCVCDCGNLKSTMRRGALDATAPSIGGIVQKPSIEAVYDFYGLKILGRGHGAWVKAQCPLPSHEDSNPSASVNTDEGKWFCHGCNQHGDGFDIVKARENVTGWSALQARAHEIAGGDSSPLPPERDRSSLLPGKPRARAERRGFIPPWSRL